MTRVFFGLLLLTSAAAAVAQPVAIIGSDAAACRPGASGPAALVSIEGLKDRNDVIRVELYNATSDDFLSDTDKLEAAGKTFRRISAPLPPAGPVAMCVKLPGPGSYALTVIHQRGPTTAFNYRVDGIGFSNNPRLYFSSPSASSVAVDFGPGVTPVAIIMNYKQGLSMRPLPTSR